ncbi:MAG: hypothetical protein ACTSUE_18050 [Promethearchaeota archaeon]
MLIENFGIAGIILIIVLWIYEGFHLKFLDQVVDDGRVMKKPVLYFLIVFSGLVSGYFMAADVFTAGAVLALCLGMVLARKIDHPYWSIQIILVVGFYVTFGVLFTRTVKGYSINLVELFIIFIIVLIGCIADEVTHEAISKMKPSKLKAILERRLIMKAIVVFMPFFFAEVEWFHVVAWIFFDTAYEVTAMSYPSKHGESKVQQD